MFQLRFRGSRIIRALLIEARRYERYAASNLKKAKTAPTRRPKRKKGEEYVIEGRANTKRGYRSSAKWDLRQAKSNRFLASRINPRDSYWLSLEDMERLSITV